MANTSQIIKLKLEPSYMRYYSSDTDFGIYTCIFIENLIPDISLDLKKDDTFIVTGNMPKLTLGKQYIAFCEEVYHPTYGKQYKIQSIYSETATSDEEERNYLASLVSELQYKNITKVYPSPVTAIKDGTFDYTKVYGIGQKTYEII
jgi:hypothetical protein